ncbi:GNAT family N-acetyltransferase [Aliiroseovarius sp. YM-037]|uniref:GNAT family N-acetyltransferase n=1 Tax=Aliiroseovarius sp. YM-037 TaxID=3341728 RepID=UPI003A7F6C24
MQVAAWVSGSTAYGWLLIKVLWVAPQMRRQGLGRALVADAFRRARELGCHSAWLDTSDKDAKQFYVALGFEVFGSLRNQADQAPPGHQRWFLKCLIP